MRLTVPLKLKPSDEQRAALRHTLELANAAANAISTLAWRERTFGQFKLHRLAYAETRARSGLSSQLVVRVIAKVADAYKLDHVRPRRFAPLGSLAYDERILRYRRDSVSIWTIGGRQEIAFVCSTRQRNLLDSQQGESDLVCRDGQWFLYATVNVVETPEAQVTDVLGIDVGIVNIATDSDGRVYSGAQVTGLRHRHRRLRARLQQKRTRSARRLLRHRRRHEHRFATHVNHTLSKRIVAEAQGTGRGIALEALGGIRERVSVSRSQRATLHSWAFNQLRQFVAYKAKLAGVPVVYVDPRNTSRTCPACGLVDKRNRASQASFQCVGCGVAGHADTIAALNIRVRGRASVMRPYAAGVGPAVSKLLAAKPLLWLAVHYELVEQANDGGGVHGWAVRAARGRGCRGGWVGRLGAGPSACGARRDAAECAGRPYHGRSPGVPGAYHSRSLGRTWAVAGGIGALRGRSRMGGVSSRQPRRRRRSTPVSASATTSNCRP